MLRSSSWLRTSPFHGEAHGFESRTEYKIILRGGEAETHWAHNPRIAGANPAPATMMMVSSYCGCRQFR